MTTKDDFELQLKELIKTKGMKFTEQRSIILEILMMANGHLNADEIHAMVKTNYPNSNIGIATVYRTLGFLEESNLISSISFGVDGKKYENNAKQHHDHLICQDCGKILEFVDEDIENRQEQIAGKYNFLIKSHSMQIYGLCSECQKKEGEK